MNTSAKVLNDIPTLISEAGGKNELQPKRLAFHAGFSLVAMALIVMITVSDVVIDWTLGIAGLLVVLVEVFLRTGYKRYLQMANHKRAPNGYIRSFVWFYNHVAHHIIREDELGKITAMTSFIAGLAVMWFVFHPTQVVALYVMFVLSWGDPFARVGGITLKGRTLPWHEKKRWTGFMSFIIVSAMMLMLLDGVVISTGIAEVTYRVMVAQYFAIVSGALVEAYAPFADNFFITIAAYGAYAAVMG